ncbi:MAG: LysR family transcriptional regulator [Oscillospiraceae bacterium]
MKIEYFDEFIELAKSGNYLSSANLMYMSQSSLSRHIVALEKHFDVVLFDRSTRRMDITEEGRMLLPYAKKISELYEELKRDAWFFDQPEKLNTRLVVGQYIKSVVPYGVPQMLVEFGRQSEHCSIQLEPAAAQGRQRVKYDMNLVSVIDEKVTETDECLVLDTDVLAVLFSKGHPLAKRSSLTLAECARYGFILVPEDLRINTWLLSACEKMGLVPQTTYLASSGRIDLNSEERGLGVQFATEKTARHIFGDDAAVIRIEPEIKVKICIIWRHDDCNPELKKFVEFARQYIENR